MYYILLVSYSVCQVAIEGGRAISKGQAFAIGSVNLQKLLGAEVKSEEIDLVATRGGDLLELRSKVVAVISPSQKLVNFVD